MTNQPASSNDLAVAIGTELQLPVPGVRAVLNLLGEGATTPFIARYRKEATGGLDEVQIQAIEAAQTRLMELAQRRDAILKAIAEQGKLTPALQKRIEAAATKAELEDLYLPFKKKRRTRAMMARERGLEPLANKLAAAPQQGHPKRDAEPFVNAKREVPNVDAALQGARDILAEQIAERPELRSWAREQFQRHGRMAAKASPKAKKEATKFEQYYDFQEPLGRLPSHRYLALCRGESEGMLRVKIDLDRERLARDLQRRAGLRDRGPYGAQLAEASKDCVQRLLGPSVENTLRSELKERADTEAVGVFAENLRHLLLAAPLGGKPVIGIDPGLRTGCKVAAVDGTGKFLANTTLFLSRSDQERARAERELLAMIERVGAAAIAVGNGTGGREAEAWARKALKSAKQHGSVVVVSVNEAGASVYSASEVAREEFPDLDLTVRGAISIARRLQDPLSELVKIDPKAIGVGQYQHDVNQTLLGGTLAQVVQSCVNHVGVDLNTASGPLLSHVAGIGPKLAEQIALHRNEHGPFKTRGALRKVKGLGPKAFEQCAGFLRIQGGSEPLDASAVHPERYALVKRMAKDAGLSPKQLLGDAALVDGLPLDRYVDAQTADSNRVGLPTLQDIAAELKRPGRDPRASFEPPKFRDDIQTLEDLKQDMWLEGVVTNVTAFGAFVDLGVHQDGLVHISQLADRYVKDPAEVVAPGDKLRVRVLSVDLKRKRISLSAKGG